MKKYSFTLILVGVLVASLAVFGFGQAGDDFFDSGWHLDIGAHVGGMDLTFDKNFGNNQWSVNLQGTSQLPQAGEEALQGVWGSYLDETFTYTDVMSGAKSSLSESWTIGPWEHGNNNYLLEMGTSASGDKYSHLRYEAGLLNECRPGPCNGNEQLIFGGIQHPEQFDEEGGIEQDGLIAAGGPNSKISYSIIAYEDFGDFGYLPVADSAAYGTSDKYAEFLLPSTDSDGNVLAGATFDAGNVIVNEVDPAGDIRNEFNALGDGMLTVTGSGDESLFAWIKDASQNMLGETNIDVAPVGDFDASYTYSKFLVRAAYEGGPEDETNWTFEGGGS
ncbi:hypothetical protein KGY79_05930 [Candidatus Bipolaricaulota bacterium]|nr:hypothetical protein [Candidatus Bipolaricaulota bacterium]